MNLVDAQVTKIMGPPEFKYDNWWVPVEYDCWGQLGKTELMFMTKEAAEKLKINFKFLT